MPHTIHIDPASRCARIRMTGTVDGRGVTEACQEVFSHPDWEPGFSTLWDTRHISSLVLTPEDLEAYAAAAKDFSPRRGPGRSAFVTTDVDVKMNVLLFGIKSMGSEIRSFRVFCNLESAEAWVARGTGARAA